MNAPFERPQVFFRPFLAVSLIYMVVSLVPLVIVDIITFWFVQWGYQFFIVAIESFIFSLLFTVLSFIEFCSLRRLIYTQEEEDYLAIDHKTYETSYANAPLKTYKSGDESTLQGADTQITRNNRFMSSEIDQPFHDREEVLYQRNNLKLVVDRLKRMGMEDLIVEFVKQGNKSSNRRAFDFSDLPKEKVREIEKMFERRSSSVGELRVFDRTFAPTKQEVAADYPVSTPQSPRDLYAHGQIYSEDAIEDMREQLKVEYQYDNCHAESVPEKPFRRPQRDAQKRARKVQTLTTDLAIGPSPKKVYPSQEPPEVGISFGQGLINRVLCHVEEDDYYRLPNRRLKQIPPFELGDIMGEFERDDHGDFIIVEEGNTLEDAMGRSVNRKGYLLDQDGNVVNTKGRLMFYANELTADGELPQPFDFEKERKHMHQLHRQEYQMKDREMNNGEKIGVSRNLGEMRDDPQVDNRMQRIKEKFEEAKGGETPVGSDIEDNPGDFLRHRMGTGARPQRMETLGGLLETETGGSLSI